MVYIYFFIKEELVFSRLDLQRFPNEDDIYNMFKAYFN